MTTTTTVRAHRVTPYLEYLAAEADFLRSTGETVDGAARRFGLTRNAFTRNLKRAGREDITIALDANRPGWQDYHRPSHAEHRPYGYSTR
jgi:hypothetical protein